MTFKRHALGFSYQQKKIPKIDHMCHFRSIVCERKLFIQKIIFRIMFDEGVMNFRGAFSIANKKR